MSAVNQLTSELVSQDVSTLAGVAGKRCKVNSLGIDYMSIIPHTLQQLIVQFLDIEDIVNKFLHLNKYFNSFTSRQKPAFLLIVDEVKFCSKERILYWFKFMDRFRFKELMITGMMFYLSDLEEIGSAFQDLKYIDTLYIGQHGSHDNSKTRGILPLLRYPNQFIKSIFWNLNIPHIKDFWSFLTYSPRLELLALCGSKVISERLPRFFNLPYLKTLMVDSANGLDFERFPKLETLFINGSIEVNENYEHIKQLNIIHDMKTSGGQVEEDLDDATGCKYNLIIINAFNQPEENFNELEYANEVGQLLNLKNLDSVTVFGGDCDSKHRKEEPACGYMSFYRHALAPWNSIRIVEECRECRSLGLPQVNYRNHIAHKVFERVCFEILGAKFNSKGEADCNLIDYSDDDNNNDNNNNNP